MIGGFLSFGGNLVILAAISVAGIVTAPLMKPLWASASGRTSTSTCEMSLSRNASFKDCAERTMELRLFHSGSPSWYTLMLVYPSFSARPAELGLIAQVAPAQ